MLGPSYQEEIHGATQTVDTCALHLGWSGKMQNSCLGV